jgi:hypothetical protein
MVITRSLANMVIWGVQACPVCYENHTAVNTAFLRGCTHSVCVQCAIGLLESTTACPMCRATFPTDDFTFAVYGSSAFNKKLKVSAARIARERHQKEERSQEH